MIGLLMLAAVTRCPMTMSCPSDADLKKALYDQASAEVEAYLAAERARNPTDMIFAHPVPVKRVADLHCGAAEPGTAATARCSFTVFSGGQVRYEMADLAQRNGRWEIVKSMVVRRE